MRGRTALSTASAAAIAVTLLLAFGFDEPVELPVRNAALRLLPSRPATATAIIAIDEASLARLGPWPWSRARLARLVDAAADAGARGVVVDVLLPEERTEDAQLAAALRRVPSAMVAVLDEKGEWVLPAPSLHATPAHGNFEVDHDGIVRRLASTKQSRDRSFSAMSVEAASMITSKPIPVGISIAPAFRTPARSVPQISAASVLLHPPQTFHNKVVFLGATAYGLTDRVLTPTSKTHLLDPGVTVHAAATESLVRGEVIRVIPPIASGILAGALVFVILRARRRMLTLLLFLTVLVSGVLLLATQIAIPFVTLLFVILIVQSSIEIAGAAAAARKRARERAAEAESKRRLAHELKTPLASMRGLTQLLAQFELSDDERRRVTTLLESEAGKLQSLVQVMLDIERLPLRDFQSTSSVLDLGDLVTKRIDFLRASTDRTLSVSAAPGVLVRADAALLERVVDNLVGNALKYTTDAIDVRVGANDGAAILEVEDRGPGIAAADRERVFERFVRGSTAAGTHGLGLGLSLVMEIARWHRGSVALEDAPRGGARFRVTMPAGGA